MVVDDSKADFEPPPSIGEVESPLRPGRVAIGLYGAAVVLVLVVGTAAGVIAWSALAALTAVLAALLFVDPRLALLAYAFSIPLAQALTLEGWLGNTSKVLAIVFVLSWLATTRGIVNPRVYPAWIWMFGVWALAVTMFRDPVDLSALVTLLQLLLAGFVIADAVARFGERLARAVLWSLTASAAGAAALAIGRYIAGITQTDSVRTTAFSGQGLDEFGTVTAVSFMFVFMLVIGRQVRGRAATIAAYGALAVLVVGLLISGTRSAWVSFIIAVVVAIVRYGAWGRIAALVAVGVVAIAVLLSPSAASLVVDRTLVEFQGGGGAGRTEIWQVGLLIVEDQPITGVGIGGHEARFASTVDDSHRSWPRLEELGLTESTSPHSIYMGSLVELGVVGLILLCLIVYDLVWRDRRRMPDYLYVIVLAMFVQGLFLDLLTTKIFWLVVALACGVIAGGYTRTLDAPDRHASSETVR